MLSQMKIVYQGQIKSGKEIVIRYPEIGDVLDMLNFINTVSDEKTFLSYQGEHETLKSEGRYIKKCIKNIKSKKLIKLLAFNGDKLVGQTDIEMGDRVERHIGLFGLVVAKDFRGKGLGKKLMELVEVESKKNLPNIKIIKLEVYGTNEIARNLYKKIGFVEYGILPGGISRNKTFEDTVLMYKNI